jgi:hypothetical protein
VAVVAHRHAGTSQLHLVRHHQQGAAACCHRFLQRRHGRSRRCECSCRCYKVPGLNRNHSHVTATTMLTDASTALDDGVCCLSLQTDLMRNALSARQGRATGPQLEDGKPRIPPSTPAGRLGSLHKVRWDRLLPHSNRLHQKTCRCRRLVILPDCCASHVLPGELHALPCHKSCPG